MSIATMTVTLDANTGQFTTQIQTATGHVHTFNSAVGQASTGIKNMERSTGGLVAGLRDGMVILGQFRAAMHTVWAFTGQWVMGIVNANAQLEQMQALMRGVATATTDAGRVIEAQSNLDWIVEMAQQAPFSLNELGKSFVKLKSAGIDPTAGAMQGLTNAVAAFGGDDQVFHRATIAIQQMAGKGVISMEELRQQLGEAVPDAMKLMARSANMTVGELVKAISTGTVASGDALNRMIQEMNIAHAGSAKAMMSTWNGLISQIKTEWFKLAAEIGGNPDDPNGMYGAAKNALKALLETMRDPGFIQSAKEFGRALAEIINAGVSFARYLVENREQVAEWAKTVAALWLTAKIGMWAGGFVAAAGGLRVLTTTLTSSVGAMTAATAAGAKLSGLVAALGGPIGLGITAIGLMIAKIIDLKREAQASADNMQAFWESLKDPNARASQEQIDAAYDRIERLNDLIEKGRNIQRAGRQNMPFYDSWFKEAASEFLNKEIGDGYASADERFNSLMAKLNSYKREVRAGTRELIGRNAGDDLLQSGIARAERVLEQVEKQSSELDLAFTRIFERLDSGEITGDESRALRAEAARETLGRQIQMIEEELSNALPNGLPENLQELPARTRAIVEKLIPEMNRLKDQIKSFDSIGELDRLNTPPKSVDEMIKENRLQSFLAQTEARVAQFEAQLEDSSPGLARFRELLEGGQFGKTPDAGIVAQIEQALVRMEDLKKQTEDLKAIKEVFGELDTIGAKVSADLDTARLEASGDIYSDVSRGMAGFNRQVNTLRLTVIDSNGDLRDFEQRVAEIRSQIAETDLTQFTRDMQDLGDKAREAVMTPREASASALNRQLRENDQRLRQILNQHVGNEEQITEARRVHLATRQALENQFAFDNRTALQRWVDDYKDITEEIDQAWVNAMDSITDSIMNMVETGKFSFADLATSILKEIARVVTARVVAQFADMMLNAFGGGGGMGGGMGGMKSVNTGYQPFGGGDPGPKSMALSTSVPSLGKSAMSDIGASKTLASGSAAAVPGNVVINLKNESGEQMEAEETGRRFDGKQMVLDIVLSAASRPGRFRDGMKGALS